MGGAHIVLYEDLLTAFSGVLLLRREEREGSGKTKRKKRRNERDNGFYPYLMGAACAQ